jgi:hypothetical protein
MTRGGYCVGNEDPQYIAQRLDKLVSHFDACKSFEFVNYCASLHWSTWLITVEQVVYILDCYGVKLHTGCFDKLDLPQLLASHEGEFYRINSNTGFNLEFDFYSLRPRRGEPSLEVTTWYGEYLKRFERVSPVSVISNALQHDESYDFFVEFIYLNPGPNLHLTIVIDSTKHLLLHFFGDVCHSGVLYGRSSKFEFKQIDSRFLLLLKDVGLDISSQNFECKLALVKPLKAWS